MLKLSLSSNRLKDNKKTLFVGKTINVLQPNGYVMHQQFNSQQLYALPTLYLSVLYLSENKQRLVPLTAKTDCFFNRDEKCLQRGTDWAFK